ncbi:MAG TPA: ABC transporter permease [Candidatus Sulfotelmatobacter sp.]
MDSLIQDVRYGWRMLRKSPGFATVAVLTLALGVGASTAVFSAVNPILFESLPYPHPNRVMAIWEIRSDGARNNATFGMLRGLAERDRSFEALAVFRPWEPTMTGAGRPERLNGQRISATYFQVLGVSPAMGRNFQPSEDRLHGPNVVIISDGLWRRRFDGDPAIVGRQISLDEPESFADTDSYTVIGVMPRSFENLLSPAAELWVPLQYDMSQGRAWGHHLRMVGRLKPNVSSEQAAEELNRLGNAVLMEQHPETYGNKVKFLVNSLQADVTRGVRPTLLAVLGAVLLVLVIACVNVTNLLLARGVSRSGEFALRAAVGAGRGRLVRQLLTESVLLAALGGVAGMAVAMLGVRALVALSPQGLPRVGAIGVDGTVFAFGFAVTTLIGLLFGLAPALKGTHGDPQSDLQHGPRHTSGDRGRIRSALVVAEVALSLVLLVCSGLLLRSLRRLFAVDAGFNVSHLLTMQVDEVGHRYDADRARYQFWTQALDAVSHAPGVAAAAFTSQLPLSGDLDLYGVGFEHDNNPAEEHEAYRYAVTPGYFQTIGIQLRRGRFLDEGDRAGAPLAAVINESFAKRKFPNQDAIGQRIHIGQPDQWYTIVGVVGDVRQMSLALNQTDAVYVTTAQWHWVDTEMSLVVSARGDAAALAPEIRKAIWSMDKDVPIVRVATMDDLLASSAAERSFALLLFEAFALASLVLAAAGIYGVLARSVAERTREIGIRLALGARREDVLRLILEQATRMTLLGVSLGIAGALAATRLLADLLFGVSATDPVTFVAVALLLTLVAEAASFVPAWRAMRVDPMVALRYE